MNQDNIDIQEVLQEREQKKKDEKYNAYVKNHTPKKSWCLNLLKAYAIGGFICVVGQALSNAYMSLGMEKETAAKHAIQNNRSGNRENFTSNAKYPSFFLKFNCRCGY